MDVDNFNEVYLERYWDSNVDHFADYVPVLSFSIFEEIMFVPRHIAKKTENESREMIILNQFSVCLMVLELFGSWCAQLCANLFQKNMG